MIPWPIALLCMLYVAIATSSSATLFQIISGGLAHSPMWPLVWWAVSAMLVVGLALMKPWARMLAVIASTVMTVGALGMAVIVVLPAQPHGAQSLLATLMAGGHLVIIRYLTRPHVRAWFEAGVPSRKQEPGTT